MPNGGPVAGQTPTGSQIQFGSLGGNAPPPAGPTMAQQDTANLSVAQSNPRVASPSSSPSPIPQPALPSGGRPPSSMHGPNNSVSFGAFADNGERRGSIPSQSNTPQMNNAHLRRESSHSQHPDMGPGAGRGGYMQGGRGRGYNQNYQQPPPHSPQTRFNTIPPNGPRAPGSNMGGPQHPGQRGGPGYQQGFPSPHAQGRSPHLASVQPMSHPPPPMPMQSPGMPPAGAYQYPPQGQHNQMQGYGYDQQAYYAQQQYMPGQMYGVPPNSYQMGPGPNSPRPPYQGQQSGYMQGQYPPQPQPMSRQNSTVSTDRPGSTLGQPPQTPMTPVSGHAHTASRGANSPGPKSSAFQIPVKKASTAIKITNPNTGEALKFDKQPASPAPSGASKGPESAPTPPPRTPSSQHNRAESKVTKTKEEVQREIREQVQAKIKADEEEAQKKKDEEEAKKRKEQEEAEQAAREKAEAEEAARKAEEDKKAKAEQAAKEAEEARLSQERAIEAEKAKAAQEEAAQKKIQEEKARVAAAAAAETKAAPASTESKNEPKEPEMPDMNASDEVWAKYDKELAEFEEAKEAAYAKKKAARKADEDKLAAEKAAKLDDDLKKQEAEAERIEAEKEKKREAGESNADDDFAALRKSANAFKATETATEILPEHGSGANSGADTPKSDASAMPPPSRPGQKPKPAALKLETQKQVEAAQPSAALQSLRSARRLAHVNPNLYPEGIQSPNPALNTNARGSFRYDKDFLMQFQKVFTEKPSETWSDKLKETVGDTDNPQSARVNKSLGARNPFRSGAFPSNFGGGAGFGSTPMGAPPKTSAERFEIASNSSSGRRPPPPGAFIRYDSKGPGMGQFGSGSSLRQPSNGMSAGRNPSSAGSGRGGGGGGSKRGGHPAKDKKADSSMPLTAGMDLKPIKVSESGWKPRSLVEGTNSGPPPGGDQAAYLDPAAVQRKVKSNLNKMTPTTFEKIGNQILEIVGQSKQETDGRTLRQVIQLTFEKATDEAHWAEMYAQFCGKMLQSMTPEIRDETLPKDKNGQVISGSTLFRKYLLNRCQQDFEQGWKSKLPDKPEDGPPGEAAMLSEEYYIAAAAKRRGLGLVRFIGELFKLSMLTARIMHMCVQRLVDFDGMPDEAEVESLTSLLRTIGANLDNLDEKSKTMMNAYFDRINTMIQTEGLPSRLRFMLMDIVDLRKKNWQDKKAQNKGPATIDQVRADAAAAQREAEAKAALDQANRRGGGGGRPGIGRGDARNFSNNGPPPDFQNNRVNTDDLRRLGKGGSMRTGAAGPMGPTSMFNTARGSNKRASMAPGGIFAKGNDDSAGSSRTGTPTIKSDKERREEADKAAKGANAFSALAALENEGNDTTSPPASVAALSPPTQTRTLADRSKSPEKGNDAGSSA